MTTPLTATPATLPVDRFGVEVHPLVWPGCLGCYNAGRLQGRWVDHDQIEEDGLRKLTGCTRPDHEEVGIFDHEYLLLKIGEYPSPEELEQVLVASERAAQMTLDRGIPWEVLVEFVQGRAYEAGQLDGALNEAGDRYRGVWQDGADYAYEEYTGSYAEVLDALPAEVTGAIDWGQVWDELRSDGAELVYFDGGCHIFAG